MSFDNYGIMGRRGLSWEQRIANIEGYLDSLDALDEVPRKHTTLPAHIQNLSTSIEIMHKDLRDHIEINQGQTVGRIKNHVDMVVRSATLPSPADEKLSAIAKLLKEYRGFALAEKITEVITGV